MGTQSPAALAVVSDYVAAIAARDSDGMDRLRAPVFVLDSVPGDAFQERAATASAAQSFWAAWFTGFPELDMEITRTVAAAEVVVTQWVFTGTNSGPLEPPLCKRRVPPTGRTIRLRGVSVYDVSDGLIQRETIYLDLATLFVELGIEP